MTSSTALLDLSPTTAQHLLDEAWLYAALDDGEVAERISDEDLATYEFLRPPPGFAPGAGPGRANWPYRKES